LLSKSATDDFVLALKVTCLVKEDVAVG